MVLLPLSTLPNILVNFHHTVNFSDKPETGKESNCSWKKKKVIELYVT